MRDEHTYNIHNILCVYSLLLAVLKHYRTEQLIHIKKFKQPKNLTTLKFLRNILGGSAYIFPWAWQKVNPLQPAANPPSLACMER